MTSARLFFHTNIRFLRDRKRLTQEDFSQKLGLTRVKLASLESGRTENPTAADLMKFSDFFHISIDTLFRVDLTKLSELKLRELESGSDVYITGSNLRVLAISTDQTSKENVEYVPIKAKAGYRHGYADPDFIAKLPKFSMPNLPAGGTFRMFPTIGDSMLPLPEGADVICQFVEDWTQLKPGTLCIAMLRGEQDFVFKRLTVDPLNKMVFLESLNPLYEPYQVVASDVLEIWKYHSYQSKDLPEPVSQMHHIAQTVNEILERMKVVEEKVGGSL
ncbi:XRE family transcriptional regulator [Dyadobacter alkalitolerans]|uniref:XRE family transcriptional regulator n=1 Tax=Dyadobacter alkalitolerans TaxID=492736 RepID=UPI0004225F99|nr:helix-turn-helix domain-containing protein [Dyadobacter alkalitolerans]